jgi:TatD DNase family protein
MFIDSHCHLDFDDFQENFDEILQNMATHLVTKALCISVNQPDFPKVLALAKKYDHLHSFHDSEMIHFRSTKK